MTRPDDIASTATPVAAAGHPSDPVARASPLSVSDVIPAKDDAEMLRRVAQRHAAEAPPLSVRRRRVYDDAVWMATPRHTGG